MNVREIRKIAERRGIKYCKMAKRELIRAIQTDEGNDACYATERAVFCGQDACLWRDDCFSARDVCH